MKAALILALGVLAVSASPVEQKRLIKTAEPHPGTWLTESEIEVLRRARVGFVDITDDRDFTLNVPVKTTAIPTDPRHQTLVNELIRTANQTRAEDFLREFSSFHNRHRDSATGRESAIWLKAQVDATLQGFRGNSSTRHVDHGYVQESIVARIEGSDPQLASEVVIIGAHEDSLAGGVNGQAPGADDNGSGSTTVLEVLRILVNGGFQPKRTLEFHWYAAEEQGLLGSADIARDYAARNVNVVAMLNLDVVGYQVAGLDDVGIYTDNGNAEIIQFLRVLVDEYLTFGRRDRTCGYGCSDHASWTRNGFPAAFAAEYQWHPDMHTTRDTFDRVGFQQVMEFVKLGVGFTVEASESA